MNHDATPENEFDHGIAVVAVAGRFPAAKDVEAFWRNLCEGKECISVLTEEELLLSGVTPHEMHDASYVRAAGVVDDIDAFDADFFGFTPREASVLSPQHRIFLECAHEALERAGYDSAKYKGRVGVFSGAGPNEYLLMHLFSNYGGNSKIDIGAWGAFFAEPYSIPLLASYKMNLQGPSLAIDSACSTSLVAIHLACQNLLGRECDMAIAGGIRLRVPQKAGYTYFEGGIASPDGHCRAFDAKARGTLTGNGIGLVVLKRLEDALADGDVIHAVVRGSAVNNDGSAKAGFTAPGVRGQAEVIAEALAMAGVEPNTVGYIEAHGTGTALGDPIEIAALNRAYTADSPWTRNSVPIGSVKTNIGHLDAAAGVAGFIKTVLSLKHGKIPPSLHFERANPQIDFDGGPFFVNTMLREWRRSHTPRRAAVTSLGIGGTNAHVVLEEAPARATTRPSRSHELLVMSAKTNAALDSAMVRLSKHLDAHTYDHLADVAYTLHVGRGAFEHRAAMVCQNATDAVSALRTNEGERIFRGTVTGSPSVRFLFPGQGAQYVNMGRQLYEREASFRADISRCAAILRPHLGLSLVDILYPSKDRLEFAASQLRETRFAQPALFVVEYALARLWMRWGLQPDAMIGHSLGEYVAACLAGVFTLEDALRLVTIRGALVQEAPRGAMVAVSLSEAEILPWLGSECEIAALNAPSACAISGSFEAISELELKLSGQGIRYNRLHTSHAFHSRMMDSVLQTFRSEVAKVKRNPPKIPFVANVTGKFITPAEATSVDYWVAQLRETVRFSDGIQCLLEERAAFLLDIGPGWTASTLAKQHSLASDRLIVAASPRADDSRSDIAIALEALGQLWVSGVEIDWPSFHADEQRRRVELPTYPFQPKRYWLETVPPWPERAPNGTRQSTAHEDTPDKPHENANDIVSNFLNADEVQDRIAQIMATVLGLERVGAHEDFFALGGTSVTAIEVMSKLARVFQVHLPPHELLRATTAATMASLVHALEKSAGTSTHASQSSGPIEIQAGERGRDALFLVHPVGGHVFHYRSLARAIGPTQPVYGFQSAGLVIGADPTVSIEQMAESYVAMLRKFQPNGPYCLGGSSFGGIVAYEMARMLVAQSQSVRLLALLDTPGPTQMPRFLADQAAMISYLIGKFAAEHPLSEESLRSLSEEEQIHRALEYMKNTEQLPRDIEFSEARQVLRVFAANMKAMFEYVPKPYAGQVVFFRAQERRIGFDPPNPELAWMELAAGGTTVHLVPGDHNTMNSEPHVHVIGQHLRRYLDD